MVVCYGCSAADRICARLARFAGEIRDRVAGAIDAGRSGEAVWQHIEPGSPAAASVERLVAAGNRLAGTSDG